jgi:hypothetical protein
MSSMMRLYDRNEGEYVSFGQLMDRVRRHRRPDGMAQPLLFWGSAGIGKSMRVRSFATELDLAMKIYLPSQDNSGADIVGERIVEGGRTIRILPRWLPDVDKDGPEGVLFIDEINRGPKSVRDGLLELVGDGTIMQADYALPPGWQIVAAANPADLGHDVYDIDDAMVDRFLHVAPGYDAAVWASWATSQDTMHQSAVDFALTHSSMVEAGEAGFPVELEARIKATPRALANLGFLIDDAMDEATLRVVVFGMVGRKVGEVFIDSWLDWQRGHRPMHLEQLLERDQYESILSSWSQRSDRNGLIEASNEHIIAGLLEKEPDEHLVTVVARYLAVIPEEQSFQFLDSGARTIPDWIDPLRREMEHFRDAMGRGQRY